MKPAILFVYYLILKDDIIYEHVTLNSNFGGSWHIPICVIGRNKYFKR